MLRRRKAGNLMKTGFLLNSTALPFLVLFGETPSTGFLLVFLLASKFSVRSGGIEKAREVKKINMLWALN